MNEDVDERYNLAKATEAACKYLKDNKVRLGSWTLAAAAYNAGPSRARQWIDDFGDPRGQVDPVDWVESIPFAETRNYVQRVLENTVVYDRMNPHNPPRTVHVSTFLGKGAPG